MKSFIIICFISFCTFYGISQQSYKSIEYHNFTNPLNNQDDFISISIDDWMLDSIIRQNVLDDLETIEKWKVISRNEMGLPLFVIEQYFDSESKLFQNFREIEYIYESTVIKYPLTSVVKELDYNNMIIENKSKTYYSNSYENSFEIIHYLWINDEWRESLKDIQTIYEDSAIRIYQNWNSDLEQWSNNKKYLQIFGSTQIYSDYEWENNKWNLNHLETLVFDDFDNLVSHTEQQMASNSLRNKSKIVFTFNSFNNLSQEIEYDGIDSNWREGEIRTYEYDTNQFLIYEDEIAYSNLYDFWINKYKEIHSNDSIGNIINTIRYTGSYDSLWYIQRKMLYTYNDYNKILSKISMSYDSLNNTWVNSVLKENIYNDTLLLFAYRSEWDSTANQWVERLKRTISYNSDYMVIEEYSEVKSEYEETWIPNGPKYVYEYGQTDNHKFTKNKLLYFNHTENIWHLSRSNDYHWNKLYNGVKELHSAYFRLSPNPSNDYIYISSEFDQNKIFHAQIIDNNGRVIERLNLATDEPLSIKNLSNSIYYLKIITTDGVIVLPFLKN